MREAVRSGRRANFYITENSFIDHYARDVGTTGVAVYHVLERHVNCETRSTWIGTAKMAKLLNVDQRTIQRTIKRLESLRLIRIVRSENMTTFFIVPVPPPAKTTSAPLFDELLDSVSDDPDANVANPTPESRVTTFASPAATYRSHDATFTPHPSDLPVAPYKEEQNLSNKTQEQDFLNKSLEEEENREIRKIHQSAERIINILGLSDDFISSASAAVELKLRGTKLSMDGVVQAIVTEANQAERRGISRIKFLEDSLARTAAEQILENTNLPATNNLISTVAAAVKAEAKDIGITVEQSASLITTAAIDDRRKGIMIDRFYFENVKWRSNGRVSKAEQRKIGNLEVNARVKQRLRERLGVSRVDQ